MINMGIKQIVLFTFFAITIISCSTSYISDSMVEPINLDGIYYSPNKGSKIQFTKTNDTFIGKLIWNKNNNLTDENNKNITLRNRDLIGIDLFFSLKYISYLKVWRGKFYDPTSGKTYDCEVWLTNSDQTLMARGYIKNGLLSRTESLQRVAAD